MECTLGPESGGPDAGRDRGPTQGVAAGLGLIYVPLPRTCVGLIVTAGIITDVPPYVRRRGWVGQNARQVWRDLYREGVEVRWVPAERRSS